MQNIIKKCTVSWILSYYSLGAYHNFMDVRRRHEITGSEKKDSITHSKQVPQTSYSSLFPAPRCCEVRYRGPDRCCLHSGFVPQPKNSKLSKPKSFITGCKQIVQPLPYSIFIMLDGQYICPQIWMETISLSFKAVCCYIR